AVYAPGQGPVANPNNGVGDIGAHADQVAFFSQRPNTDLQHDLDNVIFGPGVDIVGPLPGGKIGTQTGTSESTPMVAGVVALMQDAAYTFGGRYLTTKEVHDIVHSTADTISDADSADTNVPPTGLTYPRISVYKALQAVKQLVQNQGGGGGGGTAFDP